MSTSRHCYVVGCSHGDYHLHRWQKAQCQVHGCPHYYDSCTCTQPFELFPFPTAKKNIEKRQRWLQIIRRADWSRPNKVLEPKKDHRVCSEHFIDGRPTADHPDPELKLGHNKKRKLAPDSTSDREDRYNKRQQLCDKTLEGIAEIPDLTSPEQTLPVSSPSEQTSPVHFPSEQTLPVHSSSEQTLPDCCPSEPNLQSRSTSFPLALKFIIFLLLFVIRRLKQENLLLKGQVILYKSQLELLKKKQKTTKTTYAKSTLKTDKDALFYTGIDSLPLFYNLCKFVTPFVRRRWKSFKCISTKAKNMFRTSKKFDPSRTLKAEDEFLLTLIWLRLGLLKKDLANRFNISESLCSHIANGWLSGMSKAFSQFVFWPTKEQILFSKPKRYRHLPDLRAIIGCSEISIETPKDPILQTATWSENKQHNTARFLVSVSPDSAITFCSNVYNGTASEKLITNASGFLNLLEPCDMIHADESFNIIDECVARKVKLHISPGKRGQAKMPMSANVKSGGTASLELLVEQAIRRIGSFRILKHVPMSLVPSLDKIVKVACGLCNLNNLFIQR